MQMVSILTAPCGMTSHAAVVVRGWGRPFVYVCGSTTTLTVDEANGSMTITYGGGSIKTFREGECISLNGTCNTGRCCGYLILQATSLQNISWIGSTMSVTFFRRYFYNRGESFSFPCHNHSFSRCTYS